MTNCNSTDNNGFDVSRKANCPQNGMPYSQVKINTILHQIRKPWQLKLPNQHYYFCDDPDCDVVYFGEDNSTFIRSDLRTSVGQKSNEGNKTICYCFDVSSSDLESDAALKTSRAFVIEQTKNASCDCETRNPSGKCCLKNFPQ